MNRNLLWDAHHYDDLIANAAPHPEEEPERTVKATVWCGTETFLDNVEGLEPERLKMLEGSPFHKLLKLKRGIQRNARIKQLASMFNTEKLYLQYI
ncbi:hypothetical protein Tco_0779815 [Tanacetum coccineum]